jgi:hypothetical protein
MKSELQPLLTELCHLAVTRNAINTRRHRARFRKNYYAHAVRVVEAHNGSNWELRNLDPARHGARIASIQSDMAWLRQKHPKPAKWQAMGLHKLRSLVLQGEGEYAMAKHETMEFSIKHRSRVKHITKTLNCSLSYNNGSLVAIFMKGNADNVIESHLDLEEIHHYAEQYELNKAVEGMLK